jgi:hypothetical protein
VLLRHRGELGLTDDQVARLEILDERREGEVRSLRTQLAELRKADAKAGKDVASGAVSPGGPGMGGMGRSRGGMGRHEGAPRAGRGTPMDGEFDRLRQRIDDADTLAFVDANSEVLTEAQRPEAERLASAYRAALYDFRAAARARHLEGAD